MNDNTRFVYITAILIVGLLVTCWFIKSCTLEQGKIEAMRNVENSKITIPQECIDNLRECESREYNLENKLDIEREYSSKLKNRIEHLEECRR